MPYRTRRRHSTRIVHCSRPSALWGNTWRIERGWIIGWSIVWTKASYVTNDSEIVSQISSRLGCWGWRAALLDCVRSYIFWKLYHYRQVRLISALVSSFHIISLFIYIVIVDILGRVVRRPVSANPGLNFNPGFFFFSSKAFSRKFSLFYLEYLIIKL